MSAASIKAAIRDRITTLFTTCPVLYENEPEQRPDPPAPWVFCEIRGLGSDILSMGSPQKHTIQLDQFIRLHVYVPNNSTTASADAIVNQLTVVLSTQSFSGIQCLAPTPPDAGQGSDDGNWFRESFSVPFYVITQG